MKKITFKDFVNLVVRLGAEEIAKQPETEKGTESLWDSLMSDTKEAFRLVCPNLPVTHKQCAGIVKRMYEGA